MIFDHADRDVREEKSHREVRESRFFAQRLLDRDGRERERGRGSEGREPRERESRQRALALYKRRSSH